MEGKRVKSRTDSNKNKAQFKKFLKKYMIFLGILSIIFLIYVFFMLKEYEECQPQNFISKNLIDLSKSGKIEKYIDKDSIEKSKYEKDNVSIKDALKEMLEKDIVCKESKDSRDDKHPIYDVYSNGNLVLTVKLNGENVVNKLKLFSYNKWKLDTIESKLKDGIYTQNIIVPSTYKVLVNGKELSKEDINEEDKSAEGLKEVAKYTDIAYQVKYEIKNLYKEPDVEIKDENGENVEFSRDNNTIKIDVKTEKIQSKDEALAKIKNAPDIQKIAEDWSYFLSDDLKGGTHGYTSISKYLIKDSNLSKYAYQWATGIDITFVSTHTFSNPIFTDERIENFEIYSDKAFSCEVYLVKNMIVRGQGLKDKMHDRMYFVYVEDSNEWKLVNMQSM